MIPAADVGKGDPHAEVCLNQLRELAQAVTEASSGIICSRRRLVFARIGRLQHLHGFERFFPGSVQHCVSRVVVHSLECAGGRGRFGTAPPSDREVVDVIHRDRRLRAAQNPRKGRTERDGTERRFR